MEVGSNYDAEFDAAQVALVRIREAWIVKRTLAESQFMVAVDKAKDDYQREMAEYNHHLLEAVDRVARCVERLAKAER